MTDSEKPLSLADSIRKKFAEQQSESDVKHESQEKTADDDLYAGRFKLGSKIEDAETTEFFSAHHSLMDRNVVIEIVKPEFVNDRDVLIELQKKARQMVTGATATKHGQLFDFGMGGDKRAYIIYDTAENNTASTSQQGNALAEAIRKKVADSKSGE